MPTFKVMLAWPIGAGGALRASQGQRVNVYDPDTTDVPAGLTQDGQAVSWVTSDADGSAEFSTGSAHVVDIATPDGTFSRRIESQEQVGTGGGGVTDHGALTGLTDDDHPQYLLVTAADERIRDTMATALAAGSGVTITPNDGADTITIAATGGGGMATLEPTMGIWSGKYTPSGDGGATGTVDVSSNHVIYTPFTAAHSRTLAGVAIDVSAGVASSTVGVAIYAHDDTTGWPGTLVADLGTVDSSTTGIKEASTSQALTAGTGYWLAVQPRGGGPTLRMNTARLGLVPSTAANRFGGSAYGSSAGTFPASFTAIGNGIKDRSVWFELKGA